MTELSRKSATAALLIGYYVIGLAASVCFKEGGTDPSHRLFYFIVGNALGISSTALLMGVYARMNVNLAMVLATSGSFILGQMTFWLLYHSPLTWLQWLGILLVGAGTAMASCTEKDVP
jgi:drug/metabolite transporter (DMT)-like permease